MPFSTGRIAVCVPTAGRERGDGAFQIVGLATGRDQVRDSALIFSEQDCLQRAQRKIAMRTRMTSPSAASCSARRDVPGT
jgi:hypothetical protein